MKHLALALFALFGCGEVTPSSSRVELAHVVESKAAALGLTATHEKNGKLLTVDAIILKAPDAAAKCKTWHDDIVKIANPARCIVVRCSVIDDQQFWLASEDGRWLEDSTGLHCGDY